MNYFSANKHISYKKWLYRILIFIGVVSLIVYFQPREGKFSYQFDLNKPWKYGLLTASFDFPIYKDETLAEKERDSILQHFEPYFQSQKEVGKAMSKSLLLNYHSKLRHILPNTDYIRHLEKKLKEVYEAGIISSDDYAGLAQGSTEYIMIIDDKTANQHPISKLFTVKSAYEYILNSDSTHFDRNILRRCTLNEYLTPNLLYDREITESAKKDLLDNFSWASGVVQTGQKIIDRGEIIDKKTYNILESLRKESIKRSESSTQERLILIGQVLFVAILILCFMLYIDLFRKDFYQKKGNISILFILMLFFCITTEFLVSRRVLSVYMLPYVIIPITVRIFLDSRTAFITHVITIALCSITLRYPHEFMLLQIVAGLVAIFSLRELSQRSQLFRTAFLTTISYVLVYFALELITENDLSKLNVGVYVDFIINGILLLFIYPLLFLIEKTFGFTSNVTLVELSNINNSLLRKMSETVPGTFQHSMQVANLAAEAAVRVGAKSQLVRTGALYHDIGKMENPVFFTENQSGVNPHKSLSYEQSAQVVISHVTEGLRLADKNNLPKIIKEFISTHHGKGKTKYFYISWKNEHPNEEIDEALFTYPGPNPFTKEQAILMMADSVEAASRSLSEHTEESISLLVDKIIDTQVEEGCFKTCPITFKDIDTIKSVFKEKLKITYHTRVSYPELKTKKQTAVSN